MAIVTTWQMGGYIMIIYIAALQAIPESLIEASQIDGAMPLQRVRHIIFPLVALSFYGQYVPDHVQFIQNV